MSKVSLKIPAYLSNFSSLDNGRTIAKLKMFYIGETADGRVFDADFAEKLTQSLPYCPVVAYYSDITKDFVGHNSKQFIYGLVQPTAEPTFEKDEDGKEWFVTDVMLYTDRPDETGEIANKIVGKAQSLEMDPKTTKYSVFEESGKTKIRFTDGSLIGLSVLGSSQEPAFTGSEFFASTDFSNSRERFENFISYLEENSRGEQMEKQQFEAYINFAKHSYTEKMQMADDKLREGLDDNHFGYVIDMDDTSFTACILSFEDYKESFKRFNYALNDVEFSIVGEGVDVYKKLLTSEEIKFLEGYGKENDNLSTKDNSNPFPPKEDKEKEEESEEDKNKATKAPVAEEENKCEEKPVEEGEDSKKEEPADAKKEESKCESKPKEEPKGPSTKEEEGEEDEEDDETLAKGKKESQCSSNASALSDSERAELEKYRKNAKVELINSYSDMLEEDVLKNFVSKVDEYDYDKLEAELAIKFSQYSRENKNKAPKNIPFSFSNIATSNESQETNSYAELVKKMLSKN